MKKVLYFDCETTGLDPVKNDIIQLAGIIEINGVIKESFNLKMRPVNPVNVSFEALDVHGYDMETIMAFPDYKEVYQQLISIFKKFIDKYDKNDKFTPVGFNVNFDIDFLKNFFLKNQDPYFGSWMNYKAVDPMKILHFLDYLGYVSLQNYKLVTACDFFNIEIQAHDALSDIIATRELVYKLDNFFKEIK